jgi:hypothetical protein
LGGIGWKIRMMGGKDGTPTVIESGHVDAHLVRLKPDTIATSPIKRE